MKKFLLATIGLVALGMTAPAVAADLPARTYTKAPAPVVAAIYDWSGFYIGANGGYGTSRKEWDAISGAGVLLGDEASHNATGGVAGGQIGYRWQTGGWVFGLEAQGDWAGLRGSSPSLIALAGATDSSKIDAFGLFTGQIGYTWNNVLWYAKGGASVISDRYSGITAAGTVFDTARETRFGAVVGTGLEFGFTPNWSAAFEYDHVFNGDRNLGFTSPAGLASRTERIQQDVDLFTVRLNYRWGGPVIAKY